MDVRNGIEVVGLVFFFCFLNLLELKKLYICLGLVW